MLSLKKIKFLFSLMVCMLFVTCTEPFETETIEFEDILVINASITNELKNHAIYITRSYSAGEDPKQVSGATVELNAEDGTTIVFPESQPGVYISEIAFTPENTQAYQLQVTDENGEVFSSNPTSLTDPSEINNVRATRFTNEEGEDGVRISVDGLGSNETKFFRYDFEETYRIESFFNPQDSMIVVSETPPTLEVVRKNTSEKICYVTEQSNTILITETNNLSESRIEDFPLNFIERRNRKVAKRYSILVKQYALNNTSYEFYETLRKFSSSDNLFSQPQPGLITGNILHNGNGEKKVIGLFELVSVSSQRIFFSFNDIFGNDLPYLSFCDRQAFSINNPILFNRIRSGNYLYVGEDPPNFFNIAPKECVDCTLKGTNVAPEFWVEP